MPINLSSELLPRWVGALGSAGGLALAIGTLVVPWLLKRELAATPVGTVEDPYPPTNATPNQAMYRKPMSSELTTEQVATVWARRWQAAFKDTLELPQLALLVAHTILATDLTAVNHNITGARAGRFYMLAWTVEPLAEWGGARPVYRWTPVRAYMSPDASAAEWLKIVPAEALAAIKAADPTAYATVLKDVGFLKTPTEVYIPELVAEARMFMDHAQSA